MQTSRRTVLRAVLAASALCGGWPGSGSTSAQTVSDDPLSRENVLNDPAIPAAGNPQGDISIVEYFDYQCPFCKKVHPVLSKVVKDDGNVRLVFKNWPIFRGVSITAARLVMATQYQGKYVEAHEAVMTQSERLTEQRLTAILAEAGIDLDRAGADLSAHGAEIDAALKRVDDQARALGFRGTPAFIIGTFRVPGVLDEASFRLAIRDARAAAKK